jgi:hypothetical protein
MKKYFIILFIGVLISNLIFIDFWIFKKSSTRDINQTSEVTSKQNKVSPACDFSCPASCINAIKEATSSLQIMRNKVTNNENVKTPTPQVFVTTIVEPTKADQPVKEYIINFGGSVWASSDFQSVPDLAKSVNLSNYGKIKNIYFEVVAHLSNENTAGYVRLYNNSDKKVVNGSEVNFNSMKCQPNASLPINLENYTKEYQIQVKSTENSTLYIDSCRLRIVTQ